MTDEEAARVTEIIGQLWPNTPMDGMRATFYASSLRVIPSSAGAVAAVNRLLTDHVHQPTPGEVIDAAIGTDQLALDAWTDVLAVARARQARVASTTKLSPMTCRAMATAGIDWLLDVDNEYQVSAARKRFMDAYRVLRRAEVAGTQPGLPAAQQQALTEPQAAATMIDTTAAARRI